MNKLNEKIQKLSCEIQDCSVVGNKVSAELFKTHEKAPELLKLLYEFHGSKNITDIGLKRLVWFRLKNECGVMGFDGHFELINEDANAVEVKELSAGCKC